MNDDYELIEPSIATEEVLKTEHGHFLCLMGKITETPTLTVELYTKWYTLYLVQKALNQGSRWEWLKVYKVHYGHLEDFRPEDQIAYLDHVPNPLAVKNFADAKKYHLDELAEDLLMGRWQNEVVDSDIICPLCEGTGTRPRVSLVDPSKEILERCRHCKGRRTVKRGA